MSQNPQNVILNWSEHNLPTECMCGQANDSGQATQQVHPIYGTIFTKSVAMDRAMLVGLDPTTGQYFLACAAAGASPTTAVLPAIGINAGEVANGQALDVMCNPMTIQLGTPLSSVSPGAIAYLSDTTPGTVTATAPTTSGHIVQQVGIFLDAGVTVRIKIESIYKTN